MSLINKMLQELDARRSDTTGAGPFGQQIRAVPERRRIHPAWWAVLALAIMLAGVLAWVLLRPVEQAGVPHAQLPLKLDLDLNTEKPGTVQPPAAVSGNVETSQAPAVNTGDNGSVNPPVIQASAPEAVAPPPIAAAAADVLSGKSRMNENPRPAKEVKDASEATPPKERQDKKESKPSQEPPAPEMTKLIPPARSLAVAAATRAQDMPAASASAKHIKELTPQQRAENEYRKAVLAARQGRPAEAISGLELALQLDAYHAPARQALVGVLLEQDRQEDALRWAREGMQLDSSQTGLAMILARLQVEKGELRPAIETLERTLPYAADRADYQSFLAALLQRDGKHKQAAEHYLQALQRAPQNGVWWMGLGISLQADNRIAESVEAFKRAKATNTLSPQLLAFVEGRLAQLQR